MARARRTSTTASTDAQTTLGGTQTSTAKTRTRRSADEEIAACEAKLAAARDRKLLEVVKNHVTAGADKRLLGAFTAMTRLRAWLSVETYDAIRNELRHALLSGDAPAEIEQNEESDEDT